MWTRLSGRMLAVTVGAAAIAGLAAGVAIAEGQTVAKDTTSVRLRVVQSEFGNGFDSGWHEHPGPAIVQVQQGRFKIYQGNCTPHVVQAGETYIETPLVPVRAVAQGEIQWTTTQIVPNADAPSTALDINPC